jgi:hypothetical protein
VANLAHGIYEALLDEDLSALLAQHPELRSVFAKIDPEEEPARYAAFLARVIEKALSLENDPVARLRLCNEIVDRIAGTPSSEFLRTRRLVTMAKPLLLEITPPHYAASGVPRPETPLAKSTLFTGSPSPANWTLLPAGRRMNPLCRRWIISFGRFSAPLRNARIVTWNCSGHSAAWWWMWMTPASPNTGRITHEKSRCKQRL